MIPVLAAAAKNTRTVMAKSINRNEQNTMDVNEISRIAQGVVIRGDIYSQRDIRVDGQIEGTLFSEGRVVVGETAKLTGSLMCADLDLWGGMNGDVYVSDLFSIKGTAEVAGNIHVRKLQVEMGAQVNGTCRMISEEEFGRLRDELIKTAPAAESPTPDA